MEADSLFNKKPLFMERGANKTIPNCKAPCLNGGLMSQEFKDLQKEIYSLAEKKGWWIDDNIPNKLLMIHSEVSETVECYRDGNMEMIRKLINGNKPEGYPIELADIVIRIMDLAERGGIDLWEMILIKHKYNKTRPYRHGNKKL